MRFFHIRLSINFLSISKITEELGQSLNALFFQFEHTVYCKCGCSTKRTKIWRSQDELKSSRKHQLSYAVCASTSKDITLSCGGCRVGERSASFSEISWFLDFKVFTSLYCIQTMALTAILRNILVNFWGQKWKCALGKINTSIIVDFVICRFYWCVAEFRELVRAGAVAIFGDN